MNVLYYLEPKSLAGGVSNVAYYLPRALAREVNGTYFPKFKPGRDYPRSFLDMYKRFILREFDLLHFIYFPPWISGGYVLLKFADRRGAHTVLNIHGITQLEHKAFQRPISTREYPELLNLLRSANLADKIVVNTEFMRISVVTYYGIEYRKMVVIPNGVDLTRFSGPSRKPMLEGDPAILYLSRVSRIKGADILFQALAKLQPDLPNLKTHLVGECEKEFLSLPKKNGIEKQVVFHGAAPPSMIPTYYKSADICVIPSRQESFGIVVLEAMASGIPLIASNIGSFREILTNNETALLFESENAEDLSKAILLLCQNSGLRRKIAVNALKAVKEYSWENIARKYVSLYKRLCE